MRICLCMLLVLSTCASMAFLDNSEPCQVNEIKNVEVLTESSDPSYQVGNSQSRSFAVSYDLFPESDSPTLVIARDRDVSYVDGVTLSPIRVNTYAEKEHVVISKNGKYVAVLSEFRHRRTMTIVQKIRIEDWQGRRLWEMDAKRMGRFEPTPTGGLVYYASVSKDEMTGDFPSTEWTFSEPLEPHSLLVYDSKGALILEGTPHDEIRGLEEGELSQDGKYLLTAFDWMPPGNRGLSSSELNDRTCLVLYDIEEGAEVWRRFFDAHDHSRIAITRNADRILCFTRRVDSLSLYQHSFSVYLFDRDGNEVIRRRESRHDSMGAPGIPVLSPDESLCTFTTWHQRAYVISLADGQMESIWERPPGSRAITCRAVSNDGLVLFFVARGAQDGGGIEPGAVVVGGQAQVVAELDSQTIGQRGHIRGAVWSADSQSFWLEQSHTLTWYGIVDYTWEGGRHR